MSENDATTRRDVLCATGVAAATVLAGCSGGSGGGDTNEDGGGSGDATDSPTASPTESSGGSSESFDGWLDGVENYDGVVDETGSDEVTVEVGVQNGQQAYGYGPAAIRVSQGTTVVWEWTGEGGSHNVVDDNGDFESELVDEEGHTFSQTFDSTGTTKYFCRPHKALGMKGVVVVE